MIELFHAHINNNKEREKNKKKQNLFQSRFLKTPKERKLSVYCTDTPAATGDRAFRDRANQTLPPAAFVYMERVSSLTTGHFFLLLFYFVLHFQIPFVSPLNLMSVSIAYLPIADVEAMQKRTISRPEVPSRGPAIFWG